jgi:Domain of Unknown Function (DUF1080)
MNSLTHNKKANWSALAVRVSIVMGILWLVPPLEAADPESLKTPGSEQGWVSIFNGKDLTGWDGDPRFWSVRDGVLRGETTVDKAAAHNTFLIFRGQEPKDFILKLKFRIMAKGNSGVQFRSRDIGDWTVAGYQAEISNDRPEPGIGAGFVHDEQGPRGHLGHVGEFVVIDSAGKRGVIGKIADQKALLAAGYYNNEGWNEYLIVAQGNRFRIWVNGYQTLELIDNDVRKMAQGILALQLHRGDPMLVEFKDIGLQILDAELTSEGRKFNDHGQSGWVTAPE